MSARQALRLSILPCLVLAIVLLASCEAPQPPPEPLQPVSVVPESPAGEARPRRPAGAAFIERLGFSVRSSPHGLLVIAIDLDGPAAQAGTLVGDVVVGINGATAGDAAELQRLVAAARQGLQLQISRRGTPHQVAIRLEPGQADAAWSPFGLQVKDLPDSARQALGVAHGVMVTKVRAPADRTRILPGDVIIAVDQQKVQNAAEFNRLAARATDRKSAAVGLLVKRADADLFIALEPNEGRTASGSGGDASRGGGAPRPDYRRRTPIDMPLRT